MCAICNKYKCPPSCPNADEPEIVGVCDICKEEIHAGEEMVDIDGTLFHLECLETKSTKELLEMFDVDVKIAGDY